MKTALLALLAPLALAGAAHAQDFSGTWDVTGTDPALGAYRGTATLTKTAAGYDLARLVEVDKRLADGRVLALAWHGTAANEAGGVRVNVSLRRQEFMARGAGVTRGPADKTPLAVSGLFQAPAGAVATQKLAGTLATPSLSSETWTRTAKAAPIVPGIERRQDVIGFSSTKKFLYGKLFSSYKNLAWVAPYASRPEFAKADHFQVVDTTAKAWTRANPTRVVLVQKTVDALSITEETLRADAFRWSLGEKAQGFEATFVKEHVDPKTGMLGGYDPTTGRREVHGDSGLHQGVWVASQAWRYVTTGEPAALQNLETGLRALISMVDAPGDPVEFARCVNDAATADPSWTRSTALPGIAYLPGGNNDMLHGVDYGFAMAEWVLPAGHPLLVEVGKRARQLATTSKVGKTGTHAIILLGIASRLTGDAAVTKRYKKEILWSPLELLWLRRGLGISDFEEFGGRSGPHLASTTLAKFGIFGHKNPGFLEKIWKSSATTGAQSAWKGSLTRRHGTLTTFAGIAGVADARALAKDVLAEVPFPRIRGTGQMDHAIDASFCLSPWPAMPWKNDWKKNPGRMQSLGIYPLWELPDTDNYWKEGPFGIFAGGQNSTRWSSQDYLHLYWYGRAHGSLSPTD